MAKIGFIGVGNMGGPMAINLLKAGHEVQVFDLVPELGAPVVDAGGTFAESAQQAAMNVDILISMLPASAHVETLYLGDSRSGAQGLLSQLVSSTLIIDCSTISSETAKQVAAAAAQRDIDMIDAPVSGGVGGAQNGTLTFIVGGSEKAFERASPILSGMGKNLFHAGDSGAGQIAKICNNMLLSVLMTGTAEALQLGVDNGLDPSVLSEIMRKSSGGNWALEVYNPYPGVMDGVPASNHYEGGFLVDLMIKDLGLAMDTAQGSGASTPMGSLARNLYINLRKQGLGRKDFSSMQKFFQDSDENGNS